MVLNESPLKDSNLNLAVIFKDSLTVGVIRLGDTRCVYQLDIPCCTSCGLERDGRSCCGRIIIGLEKANGQAAPNTSVQAVALADVQCQEDEQSSR